MQKKFLSNLFITLGVNLLVKPLWILGIDRTFQNRLGLEQYGIYTNLFTFSLILGLLLDFGINNYNSSSLAKSPGILSRQFLPLLMLRSLLGLVYVVLTLMLGFWYGFSSHELYLLFILSCNQCLAYMSTYFRSTLTGLQMYRTDAYISAVDRLTMLVGGGALLFMWTNKVTVDQFVYVQSFGYVLAAVVSFGVLFPRLNEIKRVFTWEQLKPLLYKSLPYATLGLIMMLYTRLDVLLIKKMAPDGNTENGIYAQSTRLLEAVNMMAVLVSGLLLPMFASIIQQRQSLSPLVKLAMIVVLVPAILGVTCCYVFGDEVMKLLYHETSDYQVSVFKWSISSVLPMCVMYVFGTLLTSRGSIKLLIQCALVAFVFNVLVNSYVIPRYGALGAAMVALGTHSIIALSNTYFALNKLKLNITSIHLLKFPLLGILSYTVVVFFKETGIFSTLSLLGMHLLTGGLLVLLLQMIDPDTLKKALKRIQ